MSTALGGLSLGEILQILNSQSRIVRTRETDTRQTTALLNRTKKARLAPHRSGGSWRLEVGKKGTGGVNGTTKFTPLSFSFLATALLYPTLYTVL